MNRSSWSARRGVALAAAAVVLAGCGGAGDEAGTAVGTGADFVPAGAPLYAYLNADRDSQQWDDLEALVDRFPDGDELAQSLVDSLAEEGLDYDENVDPALGPEVVFALLSFAGERDANVLGATDPDDDGKLEELLRKLNEGESERALSRDVDGWRVVASNQAALDAAERARAGTSLADDETFRAAVGELPEEALLKLYLDGAAASRELGEDAGALSDLAWLSLAVTAEDDGLAVETAARTTGDPPEAFRATLLDDVPAGVLAAASFRSTGDQLRALDAGELPELLAGVSVDDLAELFDREAAFYVRSAGLIPEVTLLLADGQSSLDTLNRVMQRIAAATGSTTETVGERERELAYEGVAIRYGLFEGKLVVTTAAQGIAVVGEDGDTLADDPDFQEATEGAGMPEETAGFVYVDVQHALPVLSSFLLIAGEGLGAGTNANLDPLRSLLFYATSEGGIVRGKGFLRIA